MQNNEMLIGMIFVFSMSMFSTSQNRVILQLRLLYFLIMKTIRRLWFYMGQHPLCSLKHQNSFPNQLLQQEIEFHSRATIKNCLVKKFSERTDAATQLRTLTRAPNRHLVEQWVPPLSLSPQPYSGQYTWKTSSEYSKLFQNSTTSDTSLRLQQILMWSKLFLLIIVLCSE